MFAIRDILTKEEFNVMMQIGLEQAKRNDSILVDDAFEQLKTDMVLESD